MGESMLGILVFGCQQAADPLPGQYAESLTDLRVLLNRSELGEFAEMMREAGMVPAETPDLTGAWQTAELPIYNVRYRHGPAVWLVDSSATMMLGPRDSQQEPLTAQATKVEVYGEDLVCRSVLQSQLLGAGPVARKRLASFAPEPGSIACTDVLLLDESELQYLPENQEVFRELRLSAPSE